MDSRFLPHRPLVSGRIPEVLENLKAEFDSMAHDLNMYKMQRDDYERKRTTFPSCNGWRTVLS